MDPRQEAEIVLLEHPGTPHQGKGERDHRHDADDHGRHEEDPHHDAHLDVPLPEDDHQRSDLVLLEDHQDGDHHEEGHQDVHLRDGGQQNTAAPEDHLADQVQDRLSVQENLMRKLDPVNEKDKMKQNYEY